jgi:hypothetical protein
MTNDFRDQQLLSTSNTSVKVLHDGYAWTQLATVRSVLPYLGMVAADNLTLGGSEIQIGESFQVELEWLRTRFQIGTVDICSDWIARRE